MTTAVLDPFVPGGSAAHRESLDVSDELVKLGNSVHFEAVREERLVDQLDGSVGPVDGAHEKFLNSSG